MIREEYEEYLEEHIQDDIYYAKEMLDTDNKYCSIKDLAERFIEIDKEYNGESWNLMQILANIRMTEYYTEQTM